MKKIATLLVVLFSCWGGRAFAQTNVDSAIYYTDTAITYDAAVSAKLQQLATAVNSDSETVTTDTIEGGAVGSFYSWTNFLGSRLSNNAPQGTPRMGLASALMKQTSANFTCTPNNSQIGAPSWKLVGPDNNTYSVGSASPKTEESGRVDCIVSPPASPGVVFAGSNSGGLWKTTNFGNGQPWVNITDNSPNALTATTGVHSIAVNPQNNNIIFLATGITGSSASADEYGYSTGVVFTTNGGTSANSWSTDNSIDQLLNPATPFNPVNTPTINKVAYMPNVSGTTQLYLITDQQVAIKPGTGSWQLINPPSPIAIPPDATPSFSPGTFTSSSTNSNTTTSTQTNPTTTTTVTTKTDKANSTSITGVKTHYALCDIQFSILSPGKAIIGGNLATTTTYTTTTHTTVTVTTKVYNSSNTLISTSVTGPTTTTSTCSYVNMTYAPSLYICNFNTTTNTASWTKVSVPSTGQLMSLSVANTDNVYLNVVKPLVFTGCSAYTGGGGNLLQMVLATSTFSTINTNFTTYHPPTPGDPFQYIAVNPANENVMYCTLHNGYDNMWVFKNGLSGTSTNIGSNCHGDGRAVFIVKGVSAAANGNADATFSDIVLGATDGGVTMKKATATQMASMVGNGLVIAQFYGFGSSEVSGDIIEGGAQDIGDNTYMKNRTPQWITANEGGDGYDTKFDRMTTTKAYCEVNWPGFYDYNFNVPGNTASLGGLPAVPTAEQLIGGGTDPNTGNPLPCPAFAPCSIPNRPLYVSPNNTVFMGAHHLFTQVGSSWERTFNVDPKDNLPPAQQDYTEDHISGYILPEHTDYQKVGYMLYYRASNGIPNSSTSTTYADALNPNAKLFMTNNIDKSAGTSSYLYAAQMPTGITGPQLTHVTASNPWVNITPPATKGFQLTSITTDPQNPGRIWVTVGNIDNTQFSTPDNQRTNRVWYHPNYGIDASKWVDVSAGLPNVPINKILYQNTGMDILFVGTDMGVFAWDPNMANSANPSHPGMWTCWNTGLPAPMIVEDMEFNYCAGKLRIATFGRGIWETDMLNSPSTPFNSKIGDIVLYPSDYIDASNTVGGVATWTTDHWPLTGIRIRSGYTLKIQGTLNYNFPTVHMPKNGSIYVEPGAKLIVDYAHITHDCEAFWKGILAAGNTYLPQTPTNQATVTITRSIIENARVGITNCAESYPTVNSDGGIIQLADGTGSSTTFRNCTRGIAFAPYHNNSGLIHSANVSYIHNAEFEIDNLYPGETLGYTFGAGITMSNVEGIVISGCEFINASSLPNNMSSGHGIASWDAGYSVIPWCGGNGTNYTNCGNGYIYNPVFNGFNVAIDAEGDALNPTNSVFVDYAQFDKNGLGIFNGKNNHLNVFHSTFNIGDAPKPYLASCNCEKGIYTQNTQQFRIEENQFKGLTSTFSSWGVETQSTGSVANDIYENSFTLLTHDCYALGINSLGNPAYTTPNTNDIGLQYLCNSFIAGYNTEIQVGPTGNYNAANNADFIRKNQGSMLVPTGNTFNNGGYYTVANNNNKAINYYYTPNTITQIYNEHATSYYPGTVNVIPTTNLKQCKPRTVPYPGNGGIQPVPMPPPVPAPLPILQANIINSKNNWLSATSTLSSKIDGGNTAALLNTAATDPNIMEAHDQLLAVSPYVSIPVMQALTSRPGIPAPMMMDVLKANPSVIRDTTFLASLQNGIPPYTPDLIDTLLSYQGVITSRDSDEANVDTNYQNMMLNANLLFSALKTDSNGINVDTMAYWYQQLPVLWSRYECAAMLIGTGSTDKSSNVLSNIPLEFNLTGDSLNEYNSYVDFFNLITPLYQNGKTSLDLDATGIATLLNIANRGHKDASATALSLYSQIMNLPMYTCEPDGAQGRSTGLNTITSKVAMTSLKCYPNPAKDHVTFVYNVTKPSGTLKLILTNATGQTVYETELKNATGITTWNTETVPPGNYFYQLADSKTSLGSGTVSIIK
ncbi:MAG: T9SS type A sorting domain-containing protein [Flavipsychrobacter sp.]|nr:T9SS type A sorting domain-containing protein [Flavipsychrobacter sp.]